MIEAKRNGLASALREAENLRKEFGFNAVMPKGAFAEEKRTKRQVIRCYLNCTEFWIYGRRK